MRKLLKSGVTVLALAAFAAAPVVVLSSRVAYAENGKGNSGKSGGNAKGSGGQEKASGAGKENSGKKDTGRTAGNGPAKSNGGKTAEKSPKAGLGIGLALRDLFSKEKPSTKVAKAPSPKATKTSLSPSKLKKMNGAIHSSPNAKLAHIRNGNFNGPVGLAAALALADYQYAAALEPFEAAGDVLAQAEAWRVIKSAPTEEDLAAAKVLVAGTQEPSEAERIAAQALVDAGDPQADGYVAAQDLLAKAEAWDVINAAPTKDSLTKAEALVAGTEEPDAGQVAAAQEVVDAGGPSANAVRVAETALVEAWKPGDANTTDPDAVAMLTEVRSSLPSDAEIAEAIGSEVSVVAD